MSNTSARYHVSEKNGPGKCSAEPGNCPFASDDEHFQTKEEAQKEWERQLSEEIKPLSSVSRNDYSSFMEAEFVKDIDDKDYDYISKFVDESPTNTEIVNQLIIKRAAVAVEWARKIYEISPYRGKKTLDNNDYYELKKCDKTTFTALNREFNSYKDTTAILVEAHLNSRFYSEPIVEDKTFDNLGSAVRITGFEPNSREWLEARYNSVGGSDVGSLARVDFTPEEELAYWDRNSLKDVEKSKTTPVDDKAFEKKKWLSFGSHSGTLYRGTVWEDRSRVEFAKDHPELKVYNTKDQFAHAHREWQKVNFDGVVSDRADGEPTGILEFKTANDPEKWKNGVPVNYRAQVLYYLNASDLDYAYVGARFNDGDTQYFKLYRNDPVAPGVYEKDMESYINERVLPWWNSLKMKRAS